VAALIHPLTGESFPLVAEEISREDGTTKQDCEINAAKRLLPKLASMYPHLDVVLIADSLYSKTPIMALAKSLNMNFILVAKPGDHSHLQEQLTGLRLAQGVTSWEKEEQQGKVSRKTVEIAHDVPLFATTDITAHWLSYSEKSSSGKGGYQNGWVTSIKPTKKNALELVAAGRHRSSIENQTFNALKNHGHHFEHNFGHGKEHLRFNFIILNLLAFLMHQLLEIGDELYTQARTWNGAVRNFHNLLQGAIRLLLWPDWTTLMNYLLGRTPRIRMESG